MGADPTMVIRVGAMVVLALVALGIAWLLQRRRPDPPTAPSYRAPSQLDRDDFAEADKPILAVVFASTTCDTCPRVWEDLEPHASDLVSTQRVDVQDDPDLHQRYRIDGVPTTILADSQGVVVQAFFGPVGPEELELAIGAMKAAASD